MWEGFYRNPDSYRELRRREVIAREFFTTKAISWGLLVLFLPQSAQSIKQRNAKFFCLTKKKERRKNLLGSVILNSLFLKSNILS
jgi:hypothetical protein